MRKLVACLVALVATAAANAAVVTFIPPNDPTGTVFTTNSNDGYNVGRGIVFQANSNTTINSVGLRHNLTGITLNYTVSQITSLGGQVDIGETILRSGSALVTTAGLQFIDFAFAPLTLVAGNNYHIEFSFNGNGNQNFFYNNGNISWNQGAFTFLEGTQGGNTVNFVVPAIRLNTLDAPVPEPISMIVFGGLVLGGGLVARKRLMKKVVA